jgi:CSLREA domain-containing protein
VRRHSISLPVAAVIALIPPALFLWIVLSASPASAAGSVTFTVTSTLDEPDANTADLICRSASGACTLRAAIEQANRPGGVNPWTTATIVVPTGTYKLTRGQLDILATLMSLTVQGAGPTATIIDGNGQNPNCYPATALSCRIFDMRTGSTMIASGMTIRNGRAGIGESGHYHGGGIHNHGNLTLRNSIVSDNVVTAANWGGGGITNAGTGIAYLENVTISGNTSPASGGGIEDLGKFTLLNATLSGNVASTSGGGIYRNGSNTVTSYNYYVTLAGNSAPGGAAVTRQSGGIDFYASVFGTNPGSGGNCFGDISTTGRNVVSDETCAFFGTGDRGGVDPLLGPLQDNGGGLPTHLPAPGSPALDTHTQPNGLCSVVADQRGFARPQGAACDSGAAELRVLNVGLTAGSGGKATGGGQYREGSTATLTATPDAGQRFVGWTINGTAAGSANPLVLPVDRTYTVVANFGAAPPPPGPVPSFTDVSVGYWAHDQIIAFAQRGITTGCGGTEFCPERGVTRAEMAVFLDRTLGYRTPPAPGAQRFADVPPDYWAYAFIDQFAQLGITTGCGPGEFCPDRGVTRAEMAAFLIRALERDQRIPATPTFADVPADHPQFGYIEALVNLGVTTGCGEDGQGRKLYCPDRGVTRAEMAVFIIRAYP